MLVKMLFVFVQYFRIAALQIKMNEFQITDTKIILNNGNEAEKFLINIIYLKFVTKDVEANNYNTKYYLKIKSSNICF